MHELVFDLRVAFTFLFYLMASPAIIVTATSHIPWRREYNSSVAPEVHLMPSFAMPYGSQ